MQNNQATSSYQRKICSNNQIPKAILNPIMLFLSFLSINHQCTHSQTFVRQNLHLPILLLLIRNISLATFFLVFVVRGHIPALSRSRCSTCLPNLFFLPVFCYRNSSSQSHAFQKIIISVHIWIILMEYLLMIPKLSEHSIHIFFLSLSISQHLSWIL